MKTKKRRLTGRYGNRENPKATVESYPVSALSWTQDATSHVQPTLIFSVQARRFFKTTLAHNVIRRFPPHFARVTQRPL